MTHAKVFENRPPVLGINGLGRIGKLTLWHQIGRKYFNEIVVNMGRQAGTGHYSIARMNEKDATYGLLHRFRYGIKSERLIEIKDEKKGKLLIDGIPVTILREARNPVDIPWHDYGVDRVVEYTGKFKDPTVTADNPKGSIRGHLVKGAKAVINSSTFNSKTLTGASKAVVKHTLEITKTSQERIAGPAQSGPPNSGNSPNSKTDEKTISVVVSYSHHDAWLLKRLRIHIKPLEREGIIDYWDDGRLHSGYSIVEEIRLAFESASVAILLISADFLASDFITKYELPLLLDLAAKRGTVIIPVVVSASRFLQTDLSRFKSVNSPDKPLNALSTAKREQILAQLAEDVIRTTNKRKHCLVCPPCDPDESKMFSPSINKQSDEQEEYTASSRNQREFQQAKNRPKPKRRKRCLPRNRNNL
ncbi:MAG: Glyceraldehyde-3-phosphate dehydrogenase 3 [Syntrophorhabdus sp. PtaU1.Bin002]|nr:MAG: Glyceraldehyde-3-phosphate dehydrogenase 3 [Syntrophorhabdus sp. PtaU1.Bin002]